MIAKRYHYALWLFILITATLAPFLSRAGADKPKNLGIISGNLTTIFIVAGDGVGVGMQSMAPNTYAPNRAAPTRTPRPTQTPADVRPPTDPSVLHLMIFFAGIAVLVVILGIWINRSNFNSR
jgi:hypothetical protein